MSVPECIIVCIVIYSCVICICLLILVVNVLQHVEDEEGNVTKTVEIKPVNKYPAVFRWTGGGDDVSIAGSFNSWRAKIPLVKRLATNTEKNLSPFCL